MKLFLSSFTSYLLKVVICWQILFLRNLNELINHLVISNVIALVIKVFKSFFSYMSDTIISIKLSFSLFFIFGEMNLFFKEPLLR